MKTIISKVFEPHCNWRKTQVHPKVNGKSHEYDILDLSAVHGKDTNEAKFDLQLKWGEIFLLVYSITDSKGLILENETYSRFLAQNGNSG